MAITYGNLIGSNNATFQYTNPNLLDNPWFTVNQRGKFSYTGTSIYTVDRWRLNGGGTVDKVTPGIYIPSETAGANITILQTIESIDDSKIYTLSIIANDNIYYSSGMISTPSGTSKDFINNNLVYLYIYNSGDNYSFVIEAKVNLNIKAVKLELGSVSTLAYDSPPNYATELLKCQRYYYSSPFDVILFRSTLHNTLSTVYVSEINFPLSLAHYPSYFFMVFTKPDDATYYNYDSASYQGYQGLSHEESIYGIRFYTYNSLSQGFTIKQLYVSADL